MVCGSKTAAMAGRWAKQADCTRELSSSLRLSNRERGIREQRVHKPSRHEVIESFRQETFTQNGSTPLKQNAPHRQRMHSRQLARDSSSERPSLRPRKTQSSWLAPPVLENHYVVKGKRTPDRQGELTLNSDHSVHVEFLGVRAPGAGILIRKRPTVDASVGLHTPLLLNTDKSDRATEKAIRSDQSEQGAGITRRNPWSRLRCASHATKEKLPSITVTRNEDGSEAVNVILHPTYLAQRAKVRDGSTTNQIPTMPSAGVTTIVRNPSRQGGSIVPGTHPRSVDGFDFTNLAKVIAMTDVLERKLTDLRYTSNPDLTPSEVSYLVSALSKLRTDALLIQERKIAASGSQPDVSRCDSNGVVSLTSWPTYPMVGDVDCLDRFTLKLFGSRDNLDVAEKRFDNRGECWT